MGTTTIEWTASEDGTKGKTWNPITGCTPVSEGCEHCYAARMAKRLAGRFGYPKDDPFRVTFHPDHLEEPLCWKKPRKIFVCSMGDLFHKDVKTEWIAAIWSMMAVTPNHTYLILTKRPGRMQNFLHTVYEAVPGGELDFDLWDRWREKTGAHDHDLPELPLPNVWLGVTAENQRTANERIPLLLDTPAALRFVSVEPMLGPVDLNKRELLCHTWRRGLTIGTYLDWVICGAETGTGARPMDYKWGRDLRDQCASAETPFFFKKGNGGEEPPEDLRIREWPILSKKLRV